MTKRLSDGAFFVSLQACPDVHHGDYDQDVLYGTMYISHHGFSVSERRSVFCRDGSDILDQPIVESLAYEIT